MIERNDCPYEKDYLVCNLPNKSELHTVQLHVVQQYMDVAPFQCLQYLRYITLPG